MKTSQIMKAEGTHRDCPVELALSLYDGVLIVEVQDKFPTGVRWGVRINVRRMNETAHKYAPPRTWATLMRATVRQR
jgi:hypothetical protein